MEKTIILGDKSLKLQSNGATPLIYKAQFGTDYFSDLLLFAKAFQSLASKDSDELDLNNAVDEMSYDDISQINTEQIYKILWSLAKTADKQIPGDLIEWLSEYDDFSVLEVFQEVSDLINNGIATKKG